MEVFHTFSEINNKYRERKMEQVFSERVKGYRLPLEFRYGYVPAIVYGSTVINAQNHYWESNKKLLERNKDKLLDLMVLHEYKLEYMYQNSVKELNGTLNENAKKDILLYKISGDLQENPPHIMLEDFLNLLITKLTPQYPLKNEYCFKMTAGTFEFRFHTSRTRIIQNENKFTISVTEKTSNRAFKVGIPHGFKVGIPHGFDVETYNKIINSFYNQKDQITELFQTLDEIVFIMEKIAKEGI